MKKVLSSLHQPVAGFHVLRIVLAVLMLFHGIAKLSNGLGGIEGMLTGVGLPSFIAYGVLVGEVVAPALLLANVLVAPAALVMAFNMVVAVALAHSAQLFALGKSGGWALELQALYFFAALSVAFLAPVRK